MISKLSKLNILLLIALPQFIMFSFFILSEQNKEKTTINEQVLALA